MAAVGFDKIRDHRACVGRYAVGSLLDGGHMYPLVMNGKGIPSAVLRRVLAAFDSKDYATIVGDTRFVYERSVLPFGDDRAETRFYVICVRENLNVFYVPEPIIVRWRVWNASKYMDHLVKTEAEARTEFDPVAALKQYFDRMEIGIPAMVGGSLDEDVLDPQRSNRFSRLREMLETDPPNLPGVRVELDDATFGLPTTSLNEFPQHPPGDRPPVRRSTVGWNDEDPFAEIRAGRWILDPMEVDPSAFVQDPHIPFLGAPEPERSAARASIWTSGNEQQGLRIKAALKAVLEEHHILLIDASQPRLGSWWQSFVMALQRGMNTKTFQDHIHEFDHRLQMEVVDKPAAEINKQRSAAVAELLAAIADVDEVAMHVYQTVIIKFDGKVIVRTIDAEAARQLERSPELLADPRGVMQMIADINRSRLPISSLTPGTIEGDVAEG